MLFSFQASAVTEITRENAVQEIEGPKKPIMAMLYTTWCGYCKQMKPIFEEAEKKYGKEMKFIKLDGEKHFTSLAKKEGIPLFFVIYKKHIILELMNGGAQPKEKFFKYIEYCLKRIKESDSNE